MRKYIIVLLLISFGFVWVPAFSADDSAPPVDRISMKKARATALRKYPGKVKDFEFEIKKGKWVYFFKIAGKDEKYHYIVIDAVSGKIISKTSEPIPNTNKGLVLPESTPKNDPQEK